MVPGRDLEYTGELEAGGPFYFAKETDGVIYHLSLPFSSSPLILLHLWTYTLYPLLSCHFLIQVPMTSLAAGKFSTWSHW